MSALPPKADIPSRTSDVRYVPKADIAPGSSAIVSNVENLRPGLLDRVGSAQLAALRTCVRHHSLTLPGAKAATRAERGCSKSYGFQQAERRQNVAEHHSIASPSISDR